MEISAKRDFLTVLVVQRAVPGSANNKIVQEKGLFYFEAQTGFWMPPLTRLDVDTHKHEILFSIKRKMRMRYLSKGLLCEASLVVHQTLCRCRKRIAGNGQPIPNYFPEGQLPTSVRRLLQPGLRRALWK